MQAAPQPPSSKLPFLPVSVDLRERQEEDGLQRDVTIPNTSVSSVPPLSPPSHTPPISPAATRTCKMEAEMDKQRAKERMEEVVEEGKTNVKEEPPKMPFWLDDDDLPPMMWDWTSACIFKIPLSYINNLHVLHSWSESGSGKSLCFVGIYRNGSRFLVHTYFGVWSVTLPQQFAVLVFPLFHSVLLLF